MDKLARIVQFMLQKPLKFSLFCIYMILLERTLDFYFYVMQDGTTFELNLLIRVIFKIVVNKIQEYTCGLQIDSNNHENKNEGKNLNDIKIKAYSVLFEIKILPPVLYYIHSAKVVIGLDKHYYDAQTILKGEVSVQIILVQLEL